MSSTTCPPSAEKKGRQTELGPKPFWRASRGSWSMNPQAARTPCAATAAATRAAMAAGIGLLKLPWAAISASGAPECSTSCTARSCTASRQPKGSNICHPVGPSCTPASVICFGRCTRVNHPPAMNIGKITPCGPAVTKAFASAPGAARVADPTARSGTPAPTASANRASAASAGPGSDGCPCATITTAPIAPPFVQNIPPKVAFVASRPALSDKDHPPDQSRLPCPKRSAS